VKTGGSTSPGWGQVVVKEGDWTLEIPVETPTPNVRTGFRWGRRAKLAPAPMEGETPFTAGGKAS